MRTQRKLKPGRWISRPAMAILLVLTITALAACPRAPSPGEQEEIRTEAKDVPAKIRVAAVRFGELIGGARCEEWFWDTEDNCWECTLIGLSRRAELDIEQDGSFSELELVYDIAEVEQVLPDMAGFIRTQCRTGSGVFIELSLRREAYLRNIPELKKAWSLSGVVLEFQCPNGRDFEVDARGMRIMKPVDDTTDPSADKASL